MGFTSFGIGFVLMKLSCLAFVLGIILFLVWAIRTLKKKDLRKWVVGLIVAGILGMIVSALIVGSSGMWEKDGMWGMHKMWGNDVNESKMEYCEKLMGEDVTE